MTNSDGAPATARWRHVVRLAVFAGFLAGLFYLVAVTRIIDVEDVRRTVSATGPVAPLTYVVVSAVLGAIFVPGPLLAAGSGVLFGPVLGTFVTLGATVGTATIASLAGRRAGRDSAHTARHGTRRAPRRTLSIGEGCGRSSGSVSSQASPTRWPPKRSARLEFRCGRWPQEHSSDLRRAHSSTPRYGRRSEIYRHRWHTPRSPYGASAPSPRGTDTDDGVVRLAGEKTPSDQNGLLFACHLASGGRGP
jgi:hypothetical protein